MGIIYTLEIFFRKYLITPIQKLIFENIMSFNVIYIITEIFLIAFCIAIFLFFIGGKTIFLQRINLKHRGDR